MMFRFIIYLLLLSMSSCMEWDYSGLDEKFDFKPGALFIVNEGNFQYGNATLSVYNPEDNAVENEVFIRANGMRLGDVANSMTMFGHRAWIVVNNSGVIFAVDPATMRETGRIEGLTSPRHIFFISPRKAYVTQLWDNRIAIVDPAGYIITGYIEVPGMSMATASTEQMVEVDGKVYCNCWSYQNRIIQIDPEKDCVTASVVVGTQPRSLVSDCRGRLWTITDGGLEGAPTGHECPALSCIDPQTMEVLSVYPMGDDDTPLSLTTNATGDTLYWINNDVWRMNIDATKLPESPFIPSKFTRYYSLTVDPIGNDVYVSDALDYQQPGVIYRFDKTGKPLGSFRAGITPGAFCWYKE